jgi:hypothetical protein
VLRTTHLLSELCWLGRADVVGVTGSPILFGQTIGELCNSLSALAGNMVDKVSLGDDVLRDPNATLHSCGLSIGGTLTVTFSRAPRFHIPATAAATATVAGAGDDLAVSSDPTTLQRVFRTLDVPFMSTPFGLELEVRVTVFPLLCAACSRVGSGVGWWGACVIRALCLLLLVLQRMHTPAGCKGVRPLPPLYPSSSHTAVP